LQLASARGDAWMVAPGWHGGHVFEGLAFDLLARRARVAAGLPGVIRVNRSLKTLMPIANAKRTCRPSHAGSATAAGSGPRSVRLAEMSGSP
jgi:hypothetical protein